MSKQLPDTYSTFEIQAMNDPHRSFVDKSDYDRLRAENEALRKDAERYRVLRNEDF